MNPDSSDEIAPIKHPAADESTHPDPITGEPGAHPVGVGVGAVGAGLAGAAIGLIAGPLGALVGAAIGAVAGGLAGHEVASADDEPVSPGDRLLSTDTAAEPVLPDVGMVGLPAGGMPGAGLSSLPVIGLSGTEVEEPAGQFHEAFTAQTWREAVEEDQLVGGDEAAEGTLPAMESLPLGEGVPSEEFVTGETQSSEEMIRVAAYFRYLHRQATGEPGDALADWISAEQEILKQ